MSRRQHLIRGVLLGTILLSLGAVVATGGGSETIDRDTTKQSMSPSNINGSTLIASQSGNLYVLSPDKEVLYSESRYTAYWDVDRINKTSVIFVGSTEAPPNKCPVEERCEINRLVILNLVSGNRNVVHKDIHVNTQNSEWHDIDVTAQDTVLVAEMWEDRVFEYNYSADVTTWGWDTDFEFSPNSGGPYRTDWTHLNDVEVLPNDRVMISLRNQDQMVFVDRDDGLLENMTLGCEDCHNILYEQHNADYIPKSNGGPAVLVADSENHRAVEYQRRNGSWHKSWQWDDATLGWVRDADRLPNGHTLITDTNGDRVIEVNETGSIVWQATFSNSEKLYEAERLGTGDESTNGASAAQLGLESRSISGETTKQTKRTQSPFLWLWVNIKPFVPNKLISSIAFVDWLNATDLPLLAIGGLSILILIGMEYRWSKYHITLRNPLVFSFEE